MHARISTLSIALILTAYGCGSSSPTASSPTTLTASPPVSDWTVTQRFVSVSGPDNCWVREQRQRLTGAVFSDLPMTVTRSAGAIRLEGSFFDVNYTGTMNGSEFSASGGPLAGGGRACQDGTSFQQLAGVSNLSGRFSADDRSMTASEVNSYRLSSGEPVTYTWEWQAARK